MMCSCKMVMHMRRYRSLWQHASSLGLFLFFLVLLNGLLLMDKTPSDESITVHSRQLRSIQRDVGNIKKMPDDESINLNDAPSLMATAPMLEANLSAQARDGAKIQHIHKQFILTPVSSQSVVSEIKKLLQSRYHQSKRLDDDDIINVHRGRIILNCDDINYVEKRNTHPKLTYEDGQGASKEGELSLQSARTKKIFFKTLQSQYILKTAMTSQKVEDPLSNIIKTRPHKNNVFTEAFQLSLENLKKLLKLQGIPGIPQVYAVCIMTQRLTNMTSPRTKDSSIHHISYVIERYDDSIPLCQSKSFTGDCATFNTLMRFLKKQPNPTFVAVKLISAIGKTFQSLSENGVFPYKVWPNTIAVTNNYDVIFTSLDSFVFLERTPLPFKKYKRLLSDLACRFWYQCPSPDWELERMSPEMEECKDLKGHCDQHNRCWGFDVSLYLCIFSRGLFKELINVMPTSWAHYSQLKNLVTCTSQSLPEYRCDWSTLVRGIEKILKAKK